MDIVSDFALTQPRKTGAWLSQVHLTSQDADHAVGIGVILRTVGGGTTWSTQVPNHPSGGAATFNDVWFTKAGAGFLVGKDGLIRKTADQGKTWDSIGSPTLHKLMAVHFPTASVGYAVGDGGFKLKTIGGGATWSNLSPSAAMLGKSCFPHPLVRQEDVVRCTLPAPARSEARILDSQGCLVALVFKGIQASGSHALRLPLLGAAHSAFVLDFGADQSRQTMLPNHH